MGTSRGGGTSGDDRQRRAADRAVLEVMRRVVLLVNDLGSAVTRAMADAGLGEFVSNADAIVLTTLFFDGPRRPKAFVGPTHMTSAGITGVLNRLEADGLVTRAYGGIPGDRRGAVVQLTPAGEARVLALSEALDRALRDHQPLLDELAVHLGGADAAPVDASTGVSPVERLEALGRMGAACIDALSSGRDSDDPHRVRTAIVLASAADPHGARPRDILQRTTLSSAGASQLVARLVEAGLLRRVEGLSSDKRAVTVKLTPRGRRDLDTRLRAVLANRDRMCQAFADARVPSHV